MQVINKNYEIFRRQNWGIYLDLKRNITGWTFVLNVVDINYNSVISKTISEHSNPVAGKSSINLLGAETDIELGVYYYDITLTTSDGQILAFQQGTFKITQPITTRKG